MGASCVRAGAGDHTHGFFVSLFERDAAGVAAAAAAAPSRKRSAPDEGGAARPSLIPSLCTHFTRAGIEWRR